MRLAGVLEDGTRAHEFGDFLYGEGIESQIDRNTDGLWEIWILDEDHLDSAKLLLVKFSEFPDDPAFAQGARDGREKLTRDQEAHQPTRGRVVDSSIVFSRPGATPYGVLTVTLIAISVAVSIMSGMGSNESVVQKLLITEYEKDGEGILYHASFPEIRAGQVWRLFTPMFLHFGIIHILFNMLWLRDLGNMIEAHKGRWLLLAFVLVTAAVSNVAQFFVSGPLFGGMSGVVYGLLGYVWMQGKFNPSSRLRLQKQVVTMMIIWFFVCLSGIMGPIANTAHGVGAGI
ncbi:rhomboid family intramembrane serine protease, partial [Planctomycetota bacterium]